MKLQLMCSHKFWEGCGYVTTTVLFIFYYLDTSVLLENRPLVKL